MLSKKNRISWNLYSAFTFDILSCICSQCNSTICVISPYNGVLCLHKYSKQHIDYF